MSGDILIDNFRQGDPIQIGNTYEGKPYNASAGISNKLRVGDLLVQYSKECPVIDLGSAIDHDARAQTLPTLRLYNYAIFNALAPEYHTHSISTTTSSLPAIIVNKPAYIGIVDGNSFKPTYEVPEGLTVDQADEWVRSKGIPAGKALTLGVANHFIPDFEEKKAGKVLETDALTPVEKLSVLQAIARWNKYLMDKGFIWFDQAKGAEDSYLVTRDNKGNLVVTINDYDFTRYSDAQALTALEGEKGGFIGDIVPRGYINDFGSKRFWNELMHFPAGSQLATLNETLNRFMQARPDLGFEGCILLLDSIQSLAATAGDDKERQQYLIGQRVGFIQRRLDKNDLNGLVADLYFEAFLREQQATIFANKMEISVQDSSRVQLLDEIAQLKVDRDLSDQSLRLIQASIAEKQKTASELESQILQKGQEINNLGLNFEQQREEFQSELAVMQDQLQQVRGEIQAAEKQREETASQTQEALEVLARERGKAIEAYKIRQQAQQETAQARKDHTLYTAQIASLEDAIAGLNRERTRLASSREQLEHMPSDFISSLSYAIYAGTMKAEGQRPQATEIEARLRQVYEGGAGTYANQDKNLKDRSPVEQLMYILDNVDFGGIDRNKVRQTLLQEILGNSPNVARLHEKAVNALTGATSARMLAYKGLGEKFGVTDPEKISGLKYAERGGAYDQGKAISWDEVSLLQKASLAAEYQEGSLQLELTELENEFINAAYSLAPVRVNQEA